MSPARVEGDASRGFIVAVGGAEDKVHDIRILRRFVATCGGDAARIAVIPTASNLADTGRRYEELFRDLGVAAATALDYTERADATRRSSSPASSARSSIRSIHSMRSRPRRSSSEPFT